MYLVIHLVPSYLGYCLKVEQIEYCTEVRSESKFPDREMAGGGKFPAPAIR